MTPCEYVLILDARILLGETLLVAKLPKPFDVNIIKSNQLLDHILNGWLDVLLIFSLAGFPRLGVAGSAIATVSATATSTPVYLRLLVLALRGAGDTRWPL